MTTIPTTTDVYEFWSKMAPILVPCIEAAANEFLALPSDLRGKLCSRTVACIMSDLACSRLVGALQGIHGVRCGMQKGQYQFYFGDRYHVRFKKFGKDFRPYYTRTARAVGFANQVYQVELEFASDIPTVENVYLGYQWNTAQTEVEVSVMRPQGATQLWQLSLTKLYRMGTAAPETIPVKKPRRVVTPKVAAEVAARAGSDGGRGEA